MRPKPTVPPPTFEQFRDKVAELRTRQKNYFKCHHQVDLTKCRELEREVDLMLAALSTQPPDSQTALPF